MKKVTTISIALLLLVMKSIGQDKQAKTQPNQDSVRLQSFVNKIRNNVITKEDLAKVKPKDKPKTLTVFYNSRTILALAKND